MGAVPDRSIRGTNRQQHAYTKCGNSQSFINTPGPNRQRLYFRMLLQGTAL